jgi:hypothetical protein
MDKHVLMKMEEPTDEQLQELLSNISKETKEKALQSHQLMQEQIAKGIIEANKKWKQVHS